MLRAATKMRISPENVAAHNEYQRRYYARPRRSALHMRPGSSPYVTRHLDEVAAAAALLPGQHVLEVGCGMGRFSRELVARGLRVTGIDLSPELLAELHRHLGSTVTTYCCDIAEAASLVPGGFDAAVGFFVLHHLPHLEGSLRALARLVRPGGAVAFAEPNAFNPLFYLQIAVTPGMTWRGDGGVRRMRPSVVGGAMRAAGLVGVAARSYGYLPPLLYNRPAGRRLDHLLQRLAPLPPLRAFQLFAGRVSP